MKRPSVNSLARIYEQKQIFPASCPHFLQQMLLGSRGKSSLLERQFPCSFATPQNQAPSPMCPVSLIHIHTLTSHLLLARRLWWIVSKPSPICPVLLSQLDLLLCLGFTPPQPANICSAVGEKENVWMLSIPCGVSQAPGCSLSLHIRYKTQLTLCIRQPVIKEQGRG